MGNEIRTEKGTGPKTLKKFVNFLVLKTVWWLSE